MPDIKLFNSKKDKQDNKNKKEKKTKDPKLKVRGGRARTHGKMPTKTSINLVIKESDAVSLRRLLPIVIPLVIIVILFGKFMVYDRIMEALRASTEVSEMQSQLQQAYGQINSFDDLEDQYAHYTYSGFSEEELARVDRVEIMRLLEKVLRTGDTTKNWSLTGNTLNLQVTGTSLRELNDLSRELEEEDIVDRCVISTANKSIKIDTATDVAASFVIYLKKPEDETEAGQAGQTTDQANAAATQTGEGDNE